MKKANRGFTLTEVMVVVFIIAIVLLTVLGVVVGLATNSNDSIFKLARNIGL
jgi:prepilin-type N-terminal cleavage/methylation domain-containing protein